MLHKTLLKNYLFEFSRIIKISFDNSPVKKEAKMKIFLSIMLVLCVLSFPAAAQSGANRQNGGDKQKRNQPPTPEPTPAKDENRKSEIASEAAAISDEEVLLVDTNLVTVPVSVADRDGRHAYR